MIKKEIRPNHNSLPDNRTLRSQTTEDTLQITANKLQDIIARSQGKKELVEATEELEEQGGFSAARIIKLAAEMGPFLAEKNSHYGDSFVKIAEFMRIYFPNGIPQEKFVGALVYARIHDKLMRWATSPDAYGESPWKDIAGYALLMMEWEQR